MDVRRETRASHLDVVRRDTSRRGGKSEQARQFPRETPPPAVRRQPSAAARRPRVPRLDDDDAAAEIVKPETPSAAVVACAVLTTVQGHQRRPRECRDLLEYVLVDDEPVVVAAAPVVDERVCGTLRRVEPGDDFPRRVAVRSACHVPRVDHRPRPRRSRVERRAHRRSGPVRRAPDAIDDRRARIVRDGFVREQRVELRGRRLRDSRRGWTRVRHRGDDRGDILRVKDAIRTRVVARTRVDAPVGVPQPRRTRAVVDEKNLLPGGPGRTRDGRRDVQDEDAQHERPAHAVGTRSSRSGEHRRVLGSVPVLPRSRSVPRGGVLGAKKMLLLFLGETGEGAGQL